MTRPTRARPCRYAPTPRLRARRREGGACCFRRCGLDGAIRGQRGRGAPAPSPCCGQIRKTRYFVQSLAACGRLARLSARNARHKIIRFAQLPFAARGASARRAPSTEARRPGARGRPAVASVPCGAEGSRAAPHCPAGQGKPRLRAREPTVGKRSKAPHAERRADKEAGNNGSRPEKCFFLLDNI